MAQDGGRTPGTKLLFAIAVAAALAIPIFMVWFLVSDREQQSRQARASITEGWGDAQTMTGPILVIPYRQAISETAVENGRSITRTRTTEKQLSLSPEAADLGTDVRPERRKRSIYEAVIYQARVSGKARFAFPPDLDRYRLAAADLDLNRAELRFGLSDPRGLGANPKVSIAGRPLRLQPGGGSSGGRGFFGFIDASALAAKPLLVDFAYDFRGNASLSLAPQAGDTRWRVTSTWPHPSFSGGFLPESRRVSDKDFEAVYRVGNLALGRSLISTGGESQTSAEPVATTSSPYDPGGAAAEGGLGGQMATISLVQPVDLYSQVNRATKYGFLFIGFTFLALLMFDVIGGAAVSPIEYLLMGAALVLFFVLLLAFAEVIGFTPAYILASAAIAGLDTAYSAAVLRSWRRASLLGALLAGLYAVLYILLSLEAFSLLIGSVLLFVALAGVMYGTRRIDWGARSRIEPA